MLKEVEKTCNLHEKPQLLLRHQMIFAVDTIQVQQIAETMQLTDTTQVIAKNVITKCEVIRELLHFLLYLSFGIVLTTDLIAASSLHI